MESEKINELAFEALNKACLHIQETLGIETGDFAGIFFSGIEGERIIDIFSNYISEELADRYQQNMEALQERFIDRTIQDMNDGDIYDYISAKLKADYEGNEDLFWRDIKESYPEMVEDFNNGK